MKAVFDSLKEIKTNYTTPSEGNFALEPGDKQIHWDHCREQFAAKFNDPNVKGFYFTHPKDKCEDIANFLTKFETIATQGKYSNSIFSKTNKPNVLWIQVSDFWLECSMRKSLLTILLRSSFNYNTEKDNFDETLFEEIYKENLYIRQTKSAVLRFMFGFFRYSGEELKDQFQTSVIKHGWKKEFENMDENLIRRRLICPDIEGKQNNFIGLESLWN